MIEHLKVKVKEGCGYPERLLEGKEYRVNLVVDRGRDWQGPIEKRGYVLATETKSEGAYPFVWDADRFEIVEDVNGVLSPLDSVSRHNVDTLTEHEACVPPANLNQSVPFDPVSRLIINGRWWKGDFGANSRRLVCADGFEVSVQASFGHYCDPRNNEGPWKTVEVGYPSAPDALLDPYMEGLLPRDPVESIFPYTPVHVVEQVIAKHGGFSHYYHDSPQDI